MNETEHLLCCLGEEAVETLVELVKVTSKSNRFSLPDRNILKPTGPTNAERLVDELNDVLAIAEMLVEAGALPPDWQNRDAQYAKKAKVRRLMEHAREKGALS